MMTPDIRPAAGSHLETAAALAANRVVSEPTVKAAPVNLLRGNVVSGDAHRQALLTALSTVSQIVSRTMGPHGCNTLVRDAMGDHFATKDGYTVLQRLTFLQETATMVLDHARSVSRALVRKVGDGSTSAVVMSDSLYRSFVEKSLTDLYPAGAVQATMLAAAEVLGDAIRKQARQVSDADLALVATVAANNDPEIGKLIADAYIKYGSTANVLVVEGGEQTVVTQEAGYRVLRGMAHECFANEVSIEGSQPTVARLKGAAVMIFNDLVDSTVLASIVAPQMNNMITRGIPFVLVAREYADDVIQTIAKFKASTPGAPILFIDHAMRTRRGSARLGDLAAVLNCKVATRDFATITDKEQTAAYFGIASEVRSTGSETVFLLERVEDGARQRAAELEEQIARVDESNNSEALSDELAELRSRVRALLGTEVTISVGGSSQQERKALLYLVDDATLAVRSAIRGGVVEGLGLTGLRILTNPSDVLDAFYNRVIERSRLPGMEAIQLANEVWDAVEQAYRFTASRVLENSRLNAAEVLEHCLETGKSFNAVDRVYIDRSVASVINPVETDIEVLKGAMSIVSLLITSDQTILTRPASGPGLD